MSDTYAGVRDLTAEDVQVGAVGAAPEKRMRYLQVGAVMVWVSNDWDPPERSARRVAALRKLARLADEMADAVEAKDSWGVSA